MASYGIPYQGSKDRIIHQISSVFPKADNFYDLFGGGFSVTHYMLLHRLDRYKKFYFNEIQSGNIELIKDALAGKYNYNVFKPKWIDRETFNRDKETCPYTRIIWSFGNNQKGYMFSEENETNKKALHNAVVFGEFDSLAVGLLGIKSWPVHLSIRGRRFMYRDIITSKMKRIDLQQLQQLQQLERLERLEQLEFSSLSYDQVEIKPNSLVYCDPPYKGTAKYVGDFDHDKFWAWVRKQTNTVLISEYTAPSDIKTLMAIRHKKTNSQTTTDSVEKLFIWQPK